MGIPFDPADPFPLLDEALRPYAEAKAHATQVDAWLGLRAEAIEAELASRMPSALDAAGGEPRYWGGLPVQSLMTPYVELRALLARLAPAGGDVVVDLGAAYGRLGHVIGRHHAGVRFVGYECVAERVDEGRRCLSPFAYAGVELVLADVAEARFSPVPAAVYFAYDFGGRAAIEKAIKDLRRIAAGRVITVVARGRAVRNVIERGHPWLGEVVRPEHVEMWSIYRSG